MSSMPTGPRRRPAATLFYVIYASAIARAAGIVRKLAAVAPGQGTPGTPAVRRNGTPSGEWWAIIRRTMSEANADRVLAVAGGVTFYGLLSLFPAITVLVSLYGLFADPVTIARHLQMLASILPEGAISIIREQVVRISQGGQAQLSLAAAGSLLIALWSANAATKAIMDALNIAYDADERRGFVRLNLVSLALTMSAIAGFIVLIAAVTVVPLVLEVFRLGTAGEIVLWAGRWPFIFLLTLMALAVLYRYGPSRNGARWRWITPGSLLATAGLVVFSMLFSWYAANFANYNKTYGSLGAAVGFMTWMWLSATIMLVGAELNAEVENRAQPDPMPGQGSPDRR